MADKYQIIYLSLSDDRSLAAVVPEFCKEGDVLFVHPQISISKPRDLPSDSYWGKLGKLAEEEKPK